MKQRSLFNEYAHDILHHELYQQNKQLFSHGAISIYEHCVRVAETAFSMIEDDPDIDKRCVVRAALLHDFFLYEWHIPGFRYLVHGWAHPALAAKKAREVFDISDKEYSCITTHMWPWTLLHPPKCREGWVVSLADKAVAMKETFLERGKRHKLCDPQHKTQAVEAEPLAPMTTGISA